MSILIVVCLVAFGLGIGVAIGAATQKSADKKDCSACLREMCDRAWTMKYKGQEFRVLPIWNFPEGLEKPKGEKDEQRA